MLAPICAWIAIRGSQVILNPTDLLAPLVLAGAVLLWVTGFDIIYACQDHEFDRQSGLRSVPVRLGIRGSLRLAALCHFGMVGLAGRDLLPGRGGRWPAAPVRAFARPPRRSDQGESGVFPRKCRGQHRPIPGRLVGLVARKQAVRLAFLLAWVQKCG